MSDSFQRGRSVRDSVFLLVLSAFFLLFRLGSGSLASWDEAVYASVAKEIFQSGRWFHLTLNHELWADKPPLAIWATALFYKWFGLNEFSARLFSALCGIATVWVTYLIGEKLFNRWTGFLGALVLLSSSHFIRFSRFGVLDVPVTLFLSLAFYFFWRGFERNRYLIFSGIAAGLAIMTKGIVGLLIFPVCWLYCLFSGEAEILLRSSYWVGLMIAVGIALPWNLYELIDHGRVYLSDVVVKHLFSRTLTVLDGHKGNPFFYIRTLVNKYHPWVLVGIVSAPFFLVKSIKERIGGVLFVTVWMFFIFFVITFMRTKLAWYIIPIYPAVSLSVGYLLAKIFSEDNRRWVEILFLAILLMHVSYSHILEQDYSHGIKGLATTVDRVVPPGQILFLYQYHEIGAVSFYMDRNTAYLENPEAFTAMAKSRDDFSCLVREDNLKSLSGLFVPLKLSVAGSFEGLRLITKHV